MLFKLYSWFRRKEPYVVGFFLLLLLFFFFLGGGGGGEENSTEVEVMGTDLRLVLSVSSVNVGTVIL